MAGRKHTVENRPLLSKTINVFLGLFHKKWQNVPNDTKWSIGIRTVDNIYRLLEIILNAWDEKDQEIKKSHLNEAVKVLDIIRTSLRVMADSGDLSSGSWSELMDMELDIRKQLYRWIGGEVPEPVRFYYQGPKSTERNEYRVLRRKEDSRRKTVQVIDLMKISDKAGSEVLPPYRTPSDC